MKIRFVMKKKMLAKSINNILAYDNGKLFLYDTSGKIMVQKLRIHKRIKSIPLLERLFRYEPRAAVAISASKFIYSDHGAIIEYNVENNSVRTIHSFSRGMNNPLTFCVKKDKSGKVIEILYGEYIWNTEKGPVSIYRYDLNTWEKVYTFPPNTITHIHNIIYDSYKNRYLIVTGDEDSESAIWEASENFTNVKMIVGGNQKYRACVVFPTETGLYYATDTPLEQNKLFFLDDSNNVREISKIPGPCIYGTIANECLYLATSVEGNPLLGKWRYRFSNKLGKGVSDRYVHIIECRKDGKVSEITRLRKDILPMWLFQFGNAQFPISDSGVYFTTQSTTQHGTYELVEE